jgi:hypothetical protein
MEQRKDSKHTVENEAAPKRNVRLDENDHHTIVGAVANHSKFKEEAQSGIESPRKKRPRIKRKLE